MPHHRREILLGALSLPLLPFALPVSVQEKSQKKMDAPTPDFRRFALEGLQAQRTTSAKAWLQFFAVPSMRCGLYVLPKGGVDAQTPHEEDEIYHVLAGRALFRVKASDGEIDQAVEPGDVLFVKRHVEHRFHDIAEDLQLLVVFSSATA